MNGELYVGKLQIYTSEVLGYGSSGTIVYKGLLDGRVVAVKRMLSEFYELANREISALLMTDEHPHVVSYYSKVQYPSSFRYYFYFYFYLCIFIFNLYVFANFSLLGRRWPIYLFGVIILCTDFNGVGG